MRIGGGGGGLNREGGLINFPPLKRGGLIREGGLNRGFTVYYLFHSYPWYFCFNSQRSSPYFVVSPPHSFFSRFVTHGQLISSVMTRFDSWLIVRASTLLALTSWCSANRGTSQNAFALLASYTVGFGFNGEYQGGTEFTRPRSCRASKKIIFRAAVCWVTYLFCARLVKPARTWATLSGPYYIACTSPHPSPRSYLCASSGRHTFSPQPLVGNNCL